MAIQDKVLRITFKVNTGMMEPDDAMAAIDELCEIHGTEYVAVNVTHEVWAKFEEAIA